MSQQITKYLLALGALLLFTNCSHDDPAPQNRAHAFDISGHYTVTKSSGSDVNMDMSIANEEGRHDIVVTVTRFSAVTDVERNLLKSQGIRESDVFNHFSGSMVMGRGFHQYFPGGENISDDYGSTSRFKVCTSLYRYDSEYEVYYCLSGTVDRETRAMQGHLSLNWRKTLTKYDYHTGNTTTEITMGTDQLDFSTMVEEVFYNQYFGFWTGEFFPLVSDFTSADHHTLEIRENVMGDTFTVVPAHKSLTYQGETFVYSEEKSTAEVSKLREKKYPGLTMTFTGPNNQRIVLFGQIWTLGDFTGSLTLIDEHAETDLATFKLRKL